MAYFQSDLGVFLLFFSFDLITLCSYFVVLINQAEIYHFLVHFWVYSIRLIFCSIRNKWTNTWKKCLFLPEAVGKFLHLDCSRIKGKCLSIKEESEGILCEKNSACKGLEFMKIYSEQREELMFWCIVRQVHKTDRNQVGNKTECWWD